MRILLVTHYYSTHAGGIEIVAGRLANLLADAHEIVWAASNCDPVPQDLPDTVHCLPMHAVNTIERVTGLPFPLWGPTSLVRLWQETRRADIVHLHDFAYLGNCAAFIFARLHGKPVVVTQHVGFIPFRSAVLRTTLRAVHATLGRIVLGRANRVVFISKVVRDYFHRFISFRTPPVLIANGVDSATYAVATEPNHLAARRQLDLAERDPVCLFVGRFVEKKGLLILKDLARTSPEVTWLMAGWGPQDPAGWQLANVRVLRGKRGAELVPVYQAADLLVLPSVGEGLPLVVQEAMSCGTPVLVGEDTAEAIDAPAGLAFACAVGGDGTAERWRRALRAILEDRQDAGERRRAVGEFARSRWSWRACADAYDALFRQIQ